MIREHFSEGFKVSDIFLKKTTYFCHLGVLIEVKTCGVTYDSVIFMRP